MASAAVVFWRCRLRVHSRPVGGQCASRAMVRIAFAGEINNDAIGVVQRVDRVRSGGVQIDGDARARSDLSSNANLTNEVIRE